MPSNWVLCRCILCVANEAFYECTEAAFLVLMSSVQCKIVTWLACEEQPQYSVINT